MDDASSSPDHSMADMVSAVMMIMLIQMMAKMKTNLVYWWRKARWGIPANPLVSPAFLALVGKIPLYGAVRNPGPQGNRRQNSQHYNRAVGPPLFTSEIARRISTYLTRQAKILNRSKMREFSLACRASLVLFISLKCEGTCSSRWEVMSRSCLEYFLYDEQYL